MAWRIEELAKNTKMQLNELGKKKKLISAYISAIDESTDITGNFREWCWF